jgi:glycosyltransferase involved in cell wall biosynthesis
MRATPSVPSIMPTRIIRVLALLEANSITGSAKSILEFTREAAGNHSGSPKIEVSVITFHRMQNQDSLVAALRSAGASVEVVAERGRFDHRIISHLQALVETKRPDVIWSHSVKSHFLVRFAGLNRGAKWVAFHHGYTTTDLKMQMYNQLDRWSLRAADRVLTVCRPFAKQLESIGVPVDRIRVQHMPIRPFQAVEPEAIAELRGKLGIRNETRVLLSVGRLSAEKGHADLIHAFRDFHQQSPALAVRLILVGEGPERARLVRLCGQFGISGEVTLVGHQDDVRPYYAIADVFALPSHSEGSPNVLLEAMLAGIPVIATTAGGIPELASDGEDALLVAKGNIGALSAAISRMLEDTELRERLSSSAQRAASRHAPDAYYRSVLSVFVEAMSE